MRVCRQVRTKGTRRGPLERERERAKETFREVDRRSRDESTGRTCISHLHPRVQTSAAYTGTRYGPTTGLRGQCKTAAQVRTGQQPLARVYIERLSLLRRLTTARKAEIAALWP